MEFAGLYVVVVVGLLWLWLVLELLCVHVLLLLVFFLNTHIEKTLTKTNRLAGRLDIRRPVLHHGGPDDCVGHPAVRQQSIKQLVAAELIV